MPPPSIERGQAIRCTPSYRQSCRFYPSRISCAAASKEKPIKAPFRNSYWQHIHVLPKFSSKGFEKPYSADYEG
ncbi:MAG TPA: hypothetical protein PLO39_07670 [Saprospiraceae bacterium]|nr:hypothetical protein [Saprospiraceae bacterium]